MHSEPSHTEILQRCQIPNIGSSLSSAEHSRFLHGAHYSLLFSPCQTLIFSNFIKKLTKLERSHCYGFLKKPVTTKVVQPPLSAETVAEWRKEFPVLSKVNYLPNCSQGPQSRKSWAAIESYLDNWATVGMDWDFWCEEVELAKGEFARLIGASPFLLAS